MTFEETNPYDVDPDGMKPERSQAIEEVPPNWAVHPPYITLDFEYEPRGYSKAMKFAAVVLDSAKVWGVEVQYSIQRGTLKFEISPAEGAVLREKAFEFVRGINAVYHFIHSGPAPEDD